MDRLGDVLMSLPAVDFLKTSLPQSELSLAVRPEVADAIRPFLKARGISEWPSHNGRLQFGSSRPDAALILHAPAQTYRELFVRRTGIRYGMYSSLSSFLFLTDGVRQRRSRADRSEAIYNAELVESFLKSQGKRVDFAGDYTPVTIPEDEADAETAVVTLKQLGVGSEFLVVHPGMGGSALNLSADKYVRLLSTLLEKRPMPLLLSCGPARSDSELVKAIGEKLPATKLIPPVSLGVLREVFRRAKGVVAPSTGPLHLAHFVGTPTLGLYSPVRSHRPLRWQPWGGEGKSIVLTPQVECPGKRECLGRACSQYLCMEKTSWELLLDRAGDFIG